MGLFMSLVSPVLKSGEKTQFTILKIKRSSFAVIVLEELLKVLGREKSSRDHI